MKISSLLTGLLAIRLLAMPAHAGTNAAITFNTNTFIVSPSGIWASNAAAINAVVTGGGGGTSIYNPAQINTNGSSQVQVYSLPATVLNSIVANSNLSAALATLSSNLNTSTTNGAGQSIASAIAATNAATSNGLAAATAAIAAQLTGATNGTTPVAMVGSIIQTNLGGIYATNASSSTISGIYGLGGIVVCPYTNLPPNLSNSPNIFTPALGGNYVQLAFASLPYATNSTNALAFEGGGHVWIVGINYITNTLLLTNALGGPRSPPASWHIESPNFIGGALVCDTNPCLKVYSTNSACQIFINNMILSSTNDQPTNLVEIGPTLGRCYIGYNWFAPWAEVTNNDLFITQGFSPPTTGGPNVGNLVGLNITATNSDEVTIEGNSFGFLAAGMVYNVSHGQVWNNLFSYCGNQVGTPSFLQPNTNLASLGVCIILQDNPVDTGDFENNYFYGGGLGYYVNCNFTSSFQLRHDAYENFPDNAGMLFATNAGITVISPYDCSFGDVQVTGNLVTVSPTGILGVGVSVPNGTIRAEFHDNTGYNITGPGNVAIQLDPAVNSIGGTYIHDASGFGLTFDGDGSVATHGTNTAEMFNGNGSGLTNLPASSLVGRIQGTNLIGTTNQSATLSGSNTLTGSLSVPTVTVGSFVSGNNADLPVGTNTSINITGPTAAFAVCGIVGAADGRIIFLRNATGYHMTIANNSGVEPTATNRIQTGAGGDITLANNPATVGLKYNGSAGQWEFLFSSVGSVTVLPSGVVVNGDTSPVGVNGTWYMNGGFSSDYSSGAGQYLITTDGNGNLSLYNGSLLWGTAASLNPDGSITSPGGTSVFNSIQSKNGGTTSLDSGAITTDGTGDMTGVSFIGLHVGNAAGLSNTFNGAVHASIVGVATGVTNTSTNYGTLIVSGTAVTYSNFNSAGTYLYTNASFTGTQPYPVGPGSGVKSATGGLSCKIIFQ